MSFNDSQYNVLFDLLKYENKCYIQLGGKHEVKKVFRAWKHFKVIFKIKCHSVVKSIIIKINLEEITSFVIGDSYY